MRIALIGLGDIAGKAYLPIVATDSRISLVLCTRNTETLSRIALQYRIQEVYTNIEELISSSFTLACVPQTRECILILR